MGLHAEVKKQKQTSLCFNSKAVLLVTIGLNC